MSPIRMPRLPLHRDIASQLVSGAKLQVPFSVIGKVMEKATGAGQEPVPPTPVTPALPPNLQVYAASLTPERALAFEVGVDRFCKDAGFDTEDTAAMYQLLKQAGLMSGLMMKTRHMLRPALGARMSRWAATKPVAMARATPGVVANVGGMLGMDWAFNKAFGGGGPEAAAAQAADPAMSPNAAFPAYSYARRHGEQPLHVNTPIYRQASFGGVKEAALPGAGAIGAMTGKTLARGVPLLGAGISGASAVQNALKGNWGRAALDVGSGLASFIPGVGTAASLALGGASGALDVAEMAKHKPGAPNQARRTPPRMMSAATPMRRYASDDSGKPESALYRAAALAGLQRIPAGQLKQAWFGRDPGVWRNLVQLGTLGASDLLAPNYMKQWGEEEKARKEYDIEGPIHKYEESSHPIDAISTFLGGGLSKKRIAEHDKQVALNQGRMNVLKETPGTEGYTNALKAFGQAAEQGEARQRTTADMMAAERGAFSTDPLRARRAQRRTRSELGPLGNESQARWKKMAPGGDQPASNPRRWGGGSRTPGAATTVPGALNKPSATAPITPAAPASSPVPGAPSAAPARPSPVPAAPEPAPWSAPQMTAAPKAEASAFTGTGTRSPFPEAFGRINNPALREQAMSAFNKSKRPPPTVPPQFAGARDQAAREMMQNAQANSQFTGE